MQKKNIPGTRSLLLRIATTGKRDLFFTTNCIFLYGVGRTGIRIPLPSCCVLRIQNEYRDQDNPATAEEGIIEDTVETGLVAIPVDIEVSKRE